MKTLFFFIISTMLFHSFLTQIAYTHIEGHVTVNSCNCTKCCYKNNSDIDLKINFNSNYFSINMSGTTIGNFCGNYISNYEQCNEIIEISDSTTSGGNTIRNLSCNLNGSLIGNLQLIGDLANFQLIWNQGSDECYMMLSESIRLYLCFLAGILLCILLYL